MSDRTKVQIRSINVKGNVYLSLEDVVSYVKEISTTEETDVRARLSKAAENLFVMCNPAPKR